MARILLILLSVSLWVFSQELIISFGNGGFKNYKIVDNTCFSFVLKSEKEKDLPRALSQAVLKALVDIKKMYRGKADGFINLRVHFTGINGTILYQICGDLVRRK